MKFTERQLRDSLGRFATGVCIVATAPEGFEPTGVTINSFTSVSIDPPLILWCLKIDSEVFSVFKSAELFTVNVLGEDQKELANTYADKTKHRLEDACYEMDESGTPVIRNSIASLHCRVKIYYEEGDHIIVIGEVMGVTSTRGEPLVYFNGKYRKLKSGLK